MADYLPPVVAKLAADISDLQRGLAQARTEMGLTADDGGRSFDRLKRAGDIAFKALIVGAGAAAVALAGIGAFGLKAAADMQQTEVAFAGIFGDASTANAFLDELKEFAARTPFEFPELADAAKMLMATGTAAEDVIPVMTKIGNVAATLGVGAEGVESVVRALGQMQGKGKASAEELQQISEAVPGFSAIKAIAEGLGVSTAEAFDMMANGAIPAGDAVNYILAGMEKFPGAAGAMERQSQTLAGVWSTLKDTLRFGLIDGIAPILPTLTAALNGLAPILESTVGQLGGVIGGILESAVPVLQGLLPIIGNILGTVGTAISGIFDQLAPVLQALAPLFDQMLTAIAPLVESLATALAPVLQVIGEVVGTVVTHLAQGLRPIVEALAPIVGRLAEVVGDFLKRLADTGVLETLGNVLTRILDAVAPLIDMFADFVEQGLNALMPLLPPITRLFTRLADAIADLMPQLRPLIRQFGEAMLEALESLVPALIPLIDSLGELLVSIAPLLPPLIRLQLMWVQLLPPVAEVAAFFAGPLSSAISGIAVVVEVVAGALGGLLNKVAEVLGALPGAIAGFAGDVWNAATAIGRAVLDGVMAGIEGAVGTLTAIHEAIMGAIRGAWNAAIDVANDLIPNEIHIGMPWPVPDINVDVPDNPFNFAKLATGTVAYSPLFALIGEYPGAATDPEIVAPRSAMVDAFLEAQRLTPAGGASSGPARKTWGRGPVTQHISIVGVKDARDAVDGFAWAMRTDGR